MDRQHLPVSCLVAVVVACCSIFFLGLPGFCAAADDRFVFSGFSAGGNDLTLDGTTGVTGDGLLALTNGNANVVGHAFHRTPVQLKGSPNGTVRSFSATFVFAIVSAYSELSTDGMAFLISPTTDMSNASGAQYLGLLNSNATESTTTGGASSSSSQVFAVELDTIQNKEFMDIDNNHVGVDINSLTSVEARTAAFFDDAGGAFKHLSLISGEAMQMWVDYDGAAKQINVTMAAKPQASKPATPLISTTYDLSTVLATNQSYVGFSGATGPIRSQHCVLAWSFAVDGPAPAIDFTRMPKPPSASARSRKPRRILAIALPVTASVLILAACAAAITVVVRRKLAYAELREDWEVEFGPHRFSYKDLLRATEGFASRNILGAGGFGTVYKGVLPESRSEVAVKRVSHESSQGIKEFISEVVSIGHLRHRNLVQLLGYCRRQGELLLVYDFMPNGSLDKHLYGLEGKAPLEWPRRFQIVKDVASGLFYLHEKWEQVVVHRDVKASNVLLDAGMNAHLGDFGLARLYDHGAALQTTRVVGTTGYMAPELARTGKASPLTDVFAFGTFLLEVACGRQPVCDTVQHGRKLLVDRVLEYWNLGAVLDTVDARLRGGYDAGEARLVLTLGLMCSHPFPRERPTMRQVMQYLDGDAPLPELTPANLTLLSMMQDDEGSSLEQEVTNQFPWSGNSTGSISSGISVGR